MAEQLPSVLAKWLDEVRPEHRDALARLHRLLVAVQPRLTISLKWGNPAYSVDGHAFFYLADQAKYVHLGLYNGAQLGDQFALVEGTGKQLRHVKVGSLNPEIESKLRQIVTESLATGSIY